MSRRSRNMVAPSAVEKLIEQRRLIQDWLRKLDDGTGEPMPAHVIARVRNDYQARLGAVMTELGDHADGVRQSLEEAETRHAALEAEQTQRKDELAELKLRRQVGELDEAKFKEQAQKLKTAVDDLAKDMALSLRDIDRYEEILEIISGAPMDTEQEPVATADVPPPEPPIPSTPPSPPSPPSPPAAPAVDEMSFLRSVTGVISAQKPPESKPERKSEPRQEKKPEPKPEPEPEEKPFFVREQAPDVPGAPGEKEKKDARRSATSDAPEGARTLVCKECQALNLPTEWYCEKCGAELAAF